MKIKNFIICMLVTICVFSIVTPAFAVNNERPKSIVSSSSGDLCCKEHTPRVGTRAEELYYYYRIYNGRAQYRIWSCTFAKWKTDWIYC